MTKFFEVNSTPLLSSGDGFERLLDYRLILASFYAYNIFALLNLLDYVVLDFELLDFLQSFVDGFLLIDQIFDKWLRC